MPGYRKTPRHIYDLIARSSSDSFYIGKTQVLTTTDLADGRLAHLGVSWDGASVANPRAVVPDAANGRWSKYNIDGWVKIRRDKKKEERTVGGWESPNFGDWSKGSHIHWHTVQAFPRETWYGQRLPLLIDAKEPDGGAVNIGFRVDRVFDRNDLAENDLLMACSLLRENINSHAAIVPTDLSVASWLEDQRVTWEILPRGEASFERVIARLRGTMDNPRIRKA